MKILFYGRVGDMVGREARVERPSEPATVRELRRVLAEMHPHASEELMKPSLRACVGDTLVGEDFRVADAETVEFFPPLSGG